MYARIYISAQQTPQFNRRHHISAILQTPLIYVHAYIYIRATAPQSIVGASCDSPNFSYARMHLYISVTAIYRRRQNTAMPPVALTCEYAYVY